VWWAFPGRYHRPTNRPVEEPRVLVADRSRNMHLVSAVDAPGCQSLPGRLRWAVTLWYAQLRQRCQSEGGDFGDPAGPRFRFCRGDGLLLSDQVGRVLRSVEVRLDGK